ncbi:HIRAN domain-containing protein [Pseudomonas sp. NA-150]|uniref:HIRAN domain-containing protein n=1 Tax=Pseudomonas sp. NA-150 TaxID=3367525 RepID=UPI0037CA4633
MSWWKCIFSQHPREQPTVAVLQPSPITLAPADDLEDDLLVKVRSLVAISGPKTPYELSRLLRIRHTTAARLAEATNAQRPQATKAPISDTGSRQPDAAPLKMAAEPLVQEPKKKRLKKAAPAKVNLPPLTGNITGGHACEFDVVGESHYQPALRKLRNGRHMATDNDFVADIVAEPDNPFDQNACAVYIEGSKVGYLPRSAAADFFQQITDMGVTGIWRFQTKAKLTGGWGDRPMVGVLLGLPKS